jgi:hypothetical protein
MPFSCGVLDDPSRDTRDGAVVGADLQAAEGLVALAHGA